jgi:hypothetical protein
LFYSQELLSNKEPTKSFLTAEEPTLSLFKLSISIKPQNRIPVVSRSSRVRRNKKFNQKCRDPNKLLLS